MSLPFDLALTELDQHEEQCILNRFDANVAWELGTLLRQKAQEFTNPVAINISRDNGQLYFHALSKPGTSINNQAWIDRKRRTVERFLRSSFYMGCKSRIDNKPISVMGISESEYAFHGGGFPIRVHGVEGILGVIVVSGLRQDQDHLMIVDVLKEYIASKSQQ